MFNQIAGADLDERIAWAVDDLAALLARADLEAILADFGRRTRRQDPVVHFYESFLAAYDPKLRESCGVYYTPEAVASYIVRSVDLLLKKDFRLKDGLAAASTVPNPAGKGVLHKVQILNPAAGTVKKDTPVMVVLGNPPYSNFGMMNKGAWILDQLREYKRGLNEKKLNLDDDFIKFIRFGQWRIEQTGYGILAFITNHTWLDGLTHRRMRESLMETFDDIYVLDLHGNSKKKEVAPDGGKDENVFDIQQGVAISIFVKRNGAGKGGQRPCAVRHAELWGHRAAKYEQFLEQDTASTPWRELKPTAPAAVSPSTTCCTTSASSPPSPKPVR